MKGKINVIFVCFLLVLLNSCSKNKAAPLDAELFNKIAKTMELIVTENDQYVPSVKAAKGVIEEAFEKHGFSYSATLHKVATEGWTPQEQGLVGILTFPALAGEPGNHDYKNVYEGQELQDLEKIFKILSG